MSKRPRRHRPPKPKRRASARRRPPRREEPDLLDHLADALDDEDPLTLLGLVSTMLDAVDPRSRDPFHPDPDAPTRDQLVESLLAEPVVETSAVLAVLAALSGDELLRRRVTREIVERAHALPDWLVGLSQAVGGTAAVAVTHVLGDADDVLVSVTLPGGHVLTAVVLVEHNLGSAVKDAFVLSEPLDDVVAAVHQAADEEMITEPLAPADARARITEGIEHGARTYPPLESDTWPSSRPLVEWMTALLPDGGTGYERPEWTDEQLAELTRRFRASRFATDLDDPGDLLSSLLWFGTDYGPGDPLRWSPIAVEIVLLDWIPRKIVAPVPDLAPAPDVLRAFIRFCHDERGIAARLTEETLGAVDAFEPEYQRLIRSDRPQGPAALLAGLLDGDGPGAFDDEASEDDLMGEVGAIMLDRLSGAVGGEAALDALDDAPLPEEPFAWASLAPDVHERVGAVLALVDRCCTELLDEQYRRACHRLLADAAAAAPEIFRRKGRAETAAAAVCWVVGKANGLFEGAMFAVPADGAARTTMQVKELAAHFGVAGSAVSQRGGAFLRALGIDAPTNYAELDLGTPRYLTADRRTQIITARDRYRAMAE